LRAGPDVSTKALPNGGEHFLGGGVLFARAETGISLKTGLRNSVPAERRITPWTLSFRRIHGIAGLAAAGSSRHRQKIAAIPASASILPRSWHSARAAPPTVAARTRIVSAAAIRLDHRKSVRPFKGIFCDDISEFESYMPSQAVRSLTGAFARQRSAARSRRRGPLTDHCQFDILCPGWRGWTLAAPPIRARRFPSIN
jgi:hypothetical protein